MRPMLAPLAQRYAWKSGRLISTTRPPVLSRVTSAASGGVALSFGCNKCEISFMSSLPSCSQTGSPPRHQPERFLKELHKTAQGVPGLPVVLGQLLDRQSPLIVGFPQRVRTDIVCLQQVMEDQRDLLRLPADNALDLDNFVVRVAV